MSAFGAFLDFHDDDVQFSDAQKNDWSSDSDSRDSGLGSPESFSEKSICESPDLSQTVRRLFPTKRPRGNEEPVFQPNPKRFRIQTDTSPSDYRAISAVEKLQTIEDNLIGDGSRTHSLPTTETTTNGDLKLVTASTVERLLQGDFADAIPTFKIIDCRYPYEFEGGHIVGANNIYTEDGITNLLLKPSPKSSVLVFHCEFSSERGPKLMRHLRNEDRRVNSDCYPGLHYPEIYLIHGGYKAFYSSNKNLCAPQCYVPMKHAGHSEELKTFRARSKSWTTRSRKQNRGRRILVSRTTSAPSLRVQSNITALCF